MTYVPIHHTVEVTHSRFVVNGSQEDALRKVTSFFDDRRKFRIEDNKLVETVNRDIESKLVGHGMVSVGAAFLMFIGLEIINEAISKPNVHWNEVHPDWLIFFIGLFIANLICLYYQNKYTTEDEDWNVKFVESDGKTLIKIKYTDSDSQESKLADKLALDKEVEE